MLKGKVKWFDAKKGFGFIVDQDGKEIFVHFSGILSDGFKKIEDGQDVTFELTEGKRGPQAINVKVEGGGGRR